MGAADAATEPLVSRAPHGAPTRLSVVLVSFNTREEILDCLASALADAPAGTEFIVVDNGSSDGSAAAIRERFPAVVVDEAGDNLGFARGVNRGVAQSYGEFVLLLNPDTFVFDGSLRRLLDFAIAHPEYGVYGGRTVHRDGSVDPRSCWGSMTPWSLACFALGLSTAFHGSRVFDPESLGGWKRDSVRVVDIITGCLLLARRHDWDALGGMDEAYFLYGEDADFSIRAARRGYRPVVVPEAVIVHDVGGSTPNSGNKMCMVMAGKSTLLRRSWPPVRARLGIGMLLTGTLVRATLERALRKQGMWSTTWARRADWVRGYPEARATLFGLPVEA